MGLIAMRGGYYYFRHFQDSFQQPKYTVGTSPGRLLIDQRPASDPLQLHRFQAIISRTELDFNKTLHFQLEKNISHIIQSSNLILI
jgi:hypothetical protein